MFIKLSWFFSNNYCLVTLISKSLKNLNVFFIELISINLRCFFYQIFNFYILNLINNFNFDTDLQKSMSFDKVSLAPSDVELNCRLPKFGMNCT